MSPLLHVSQLQFFESLLAMNVIRTINFAQI